VIALKILLDNERKKISQGGTPDPMAVPGGISGGLQDALLNNQELISEPTLVALEKFLSGQGPRPEM
jgi:hypothetical protein